jgi:hypothetical protein
MFFLGDEEAGIGVPEVMKSHPRQPGSPYTDQHPISTVRELGFIDGPIAK